MYVAPKNIKVPNEVKEFDKDLDSLGLLYDSNKCYITEEWAGKFKAHFKKIKEIAEAGNAWAQYRLGNIYFLGCIYTNIEEIQKHYIENSKKGSYWLEKAAKQSFVVAVDNLVISGIGAESIRLREISKLVEKEHPEYIIQSESNNNTPLITPKFFETVWDIAYGKGS